MVTKVRFVVSDTELFNGNLHERGVLTGKPQSLREFFCHIKPKLTGVKLWQEQDTVCLVLLHGLEVFRKNGITGAKLKLRVSGKGIISEVSFASAAEKFCVHPGQILS